MRRTRRPAPQRTEAEHIRHEEEEDFELRRALSRATRAAIREGWDRFEWRRAVDA